MNTSRIVDISLALRELPFSPVITCNSQTVTVTLRPFVGEPVSCTAASFALAWTGAINQLRGAALVDHVQRSEQADYDATIADFEAGTGRL